MKLTLTAAAARYVIHEANVRRLRERQRGTEMDQQQLQAVVDQTGAAYAKVIAHQAGQLLDKDVMIARLQANVGQLQGQLGAAAQANQEAQAKITALEAEVAALKEPKTGGSVSSAPAANDAPAPDTAPSESEPATV